MVMGRCWCSQLSPGTGLRASLRSDPAKTGLVETRDPSVLAALVFDPSPQFEMSVPLTCSQRTPRRGSTPSRGPTRSFRPRRVLLGRLCVSSGQSPSPPSGAGPAGWPEARNAQEVITDAAMTAARTGAQVPCWCGRLRP